MKYIATISGGKDSVTMCDLLLKNGHPVDHIIFNDTMLELDVMYEYIDKVKDYFSTRYNKEIIITKPSKTFEETVFGIIKTKGAERIGWIRGLPNPMLGFCEWRRDSKIYPYDREIKKIVGDDEFLTYIGFTTDEGNRKMVGEGKFLYPLIDDFRMSEQQCKEYLINQEMENPLYKHFSRTGCGVCPAQSDKSWLNIWKHYKSDWEYMKFIERRFDHYEKRGYSIINRYWFTGERTTSDMEILFTRAEQQGSLFDFSDEPLKDCFCKI